MQGGKYSKHQFYLFGLLIWFTISHITAQTALREAVENLQKADIGLEEGKFVSAMKSNQMAKSNLQGLMPKPDSLLAETYYRIGKCYIALYEMPKALSYLDSALVFSGNTPSPTTYRIQLLLGARRNDTLAIQNAITYFKGKDHTLHAEGLLALGSQKVAKKATTEPEELKACMDLLQRHHLEKSATAGRCLMLRGFHYWKNMVQYETALAYFKQSESVFLESGGALSNHLAVLYVNMGGCLDDIGYPAKAIQLYTDAEKNFQSQQENHPNLISVYNNLGRSHNDLGNYAAAIRYLEKTTILAPNNGRYWNNLGDAYLSQGNLMKAKICFEKAKKLLLENIDRHRTELARPLHNLAVIFRKQGQLDSALTYELRSLPYRKSDPAALLDQARSYLGVGECYLALQQYPAALIYLDSALGLQGRALPSRMYGETSSAFIAKSRCWAAMGDFETAFVCADSALFACGYIGSNHWNTVLSPTNLLESMNQKSVLHYAFFQKTQSEPSLLSAVQGYDLAAQAIRHFRNTLLDSESKATLAGQFREILNGGVEAALALHALRPADDQYLRLAFAFSEQSKSLVLLEGMHSAGIVKFEGVPDSILARERALREAVTEAEVALKKRSYKGANTTNAQLMDAKNLLFERQRDFERFQQMLGSGQYKAYHEFRYGFSMATPVEIQTQLLDERTTMLSYFIGKEDRITAFVIQKNSIHAYTCSTSTDLDSLVERLRWGLSGYYSLSPSKRKDDDFNKTVAAYVSAGQALYQTLLAPIDQYLSPEVIIVTDGLLTKIPFELLLTSTPTQTNNFKDYPYWFLTKNRSVSYTYSATLLREMTQKQHRNTAAQSLFAMAPFFQGTEQDVSTRKPIAELPNAFTPSPIKGNFKALPYSGEELRDICAIWSGKYKVGKSATKLLFLSEAEHYRILHLSTHGVLDSTPDFSFLAFAPSQGEVAAEPLYIRDLYDLQLNADLVTLSACQTGVGEFQRGEGVISLARAFAYAGAKSIVTSLWQVDNAATKDLMRVFYKNLYDGKPKHHALRDAKLDFIANHIGEQSHPFFWAGLVGLGDMGALGK